MHCLQDFRFLVAIPIALGVLASLGAGQQGAATPERTARTLDSYHPWDLSGAYAGDLEAWSQRRRDVQLQIRVAAGLWDPERLASRPPVQATVHGLIERAGYTVQKVILDARLAPELGSPSFHVTGSLYRPTKPGPYAGVLCPHGHWTDGRFSERSPEESQAEVDAGREFFHANARYHLQARCAQLARMGCVVFHYDMTGYADAQQLVHAEGFTDDEALRQGWSAFGVQTWSSIRALDFLISQPGVDPERLGMTGASGGGTQTFILAAIDERLDAVFPAVMASTAMQGGCKCENAPHLRVGSGNIEFAALFAPKPCGLTGANDWTLEIESKGLPQLRRLWKAFGHEPDVRAWCYPEFPHNYNAVSRGHMYAWFNEHLALAQDLPIVEQELHPIPPAQLVVYDSEHSRPTADGVLAGLRSDWSHLQGQWVSAANQLHSPSEQEEEHWRRTLAQLLHTSIPAADSVLATTLNERRESGQRTLQLELRRKQTEPPLPATLLIPDDWTGLTLIALSPHGRSPQDRSNHLSKSERATIDPADVLAQGCAFLTADLFLCAPAGQLSEEQALAAKRKATEDPSRHGDYAGYSHGYNRTLIAERVHEALTLIAFARDYPGCKALHLLGTGEAGGWSLLTRTLAPGTIALTAAEFSDDFFDVPKEDINFLPGASGMGGLASFLQASDSNLLLWKKGEQPDWPSITARLCSPSPAQPTEAASDR